jgi:uncharacterized protein DUF3515
VVAGVCALLVLCGGCSDDVKIQGTGASGTARTACESLVRALPSRVSDQRERRTTGSRLGAAWGDPPIVLRCGVGRPKDYDPAAGCQTVNGLDWFVPEKGMNDQSVDVVMTTIGRDPTVEVTLPAQYRPPATAMVDLASVIKSHTRRTTPCS